LRLLLFSLCLLAVAPLLASPARAGEPAATQPAAKPFELLDGDRVVFLGGTFFEREAKWGYIETALTSRFPDRNVTFRNLGYAGDTVRCEARTVCEGWANFGPPQEGFDRLKTLIGEIKPTVVFIAYGMGESFEGEKALPQFVADYNKLLDMLTEASGGKPRFVLIGPNYHEDLGRPLPDPAEHNRLLTLYSDAIGKIAEARGERFFDLFAFTSSHQIALREPALTDDGIQLTLHGYWTVASYLEKALGWPRWQWDVQLDDTGKLARAEGVAVRDIKATHPGLSFTAVSTALPEPQNPRLGTLAVCGVHHLHINGLPAGNYAFSGDGKKIAEDPADFWATYANFFGGPDADRVEQLRQLIVAKNADYFNYWRHENDTYILGYRKHEQGKNAVEFPEWVKLTEEKDKEIAKLRVPQPVAYALEREEKARK
jgi:hypothetical protein